MSADTLVAFYSMQGHTRDVANEIRELIRSDIEEILEPRRRRGRLGVARAAIDALFRRTPPILPPHRDPARYRVLLLGGPVWMGRMAAPVRRYAALHGARARSVAFFCTHEERGAEAAFADLARLCERTPVATLAVDAWHIGPRAHETELVDFLARAAVDEGGLREHALPIREPSVARAVAVAR